MIADLKEGLFLMTEAYKAVLGTEEEAMLEELLLKYINKSDSTACCVALRLTIVLSIWQILSNILIVNVSY